MNFEQALREQLEATADLRRRGKKILAILNARPSKRRTRQIDRMERHVVAHLGSDYFGPDPDPIMVGIDWSSIDWSAVLQVILKLLLALLPFIL